MTTGTTFSHSVRAPFPGVPASSSTQRPSPDRPLDRGAGSSDEPSFDDVFEFESGAGRSSRGDSTRRDDHAAPGAERSEVDDDRSAAHDLETHQPRARGDDTELEADEYRDDTAEDAAADATDALGIAPLPATDAPARFTPEAAPEAAPDAGLQEHGAPGVTPDATTVRPASDSDTVIVPAPPLGAAAQHPATVSTPDAAAVDTVDVVPSDVASIDLAADPDVVDSIPAKPIGPTSDGTADAALDASGATGQRSPTPMEQAGLAVAPTTSTVSSPASAALAAAPASASSVAADQLRNTEMVRRSDLQRLGAMTRVGLDITTDELGAVRVEALDRGGALHLTLRSDDGATRHMLADRSRELRESLGENLASFDVDQRSGDQRRRQEMHDRSGGTGAPSIEPPSSTTAPTGAPAAAAAAIDGPLDLRL